MQAQKADSGETQRAAYFPLGLASAFRGAGGAASTFKGNSEKAVLYAQRGLRIPGITDEIKAYLNACLVCGFANMPGRERHTRTAVDRALSVEDLPDVERANIMGFRQRAP